MSNKWNVKDMSEFDYLTFLKKEYYNSANFSGIQVEVIDKVDGRIYFYPNSDSVFIEVEFIKNKVSLKIFHLDGKIKVIILRGDSTIRFNSLEEYQNYLLLD